MQFSFFAISAVLAGFVAAQNVNDLPPCARSCAADSLPQQCGTDPICICNDASFIDNISCCVKNACAEADQSRALAYAVQICTGVGATVALPSSAGCTGAAASSTSTGTVTSSTGSTSGTHTGTTTAPPVSSTTGPGAGNKVAVAGGAGLAGIILGAAVLL